jgi:hypothetical protein
MNQDAEHVRLLSIFHYVVAGLAAFFSFFPLLYTMIGAIFIFAARHGTAKPGEDLPPEFLGWIFAVLGSLLFLIGIAMAICILIAGRSLALRKRYLFVLVMACIECLFIPFGTILGVFRLLRFRANRSGDCSPPQPHKRLAETLLYKLSEDQLAATGQRPVPLEPAL